QTPPSFSSAQEAQKVHSNEHIKASVDSGGRSRSQHSQFGRNASMGRSSSLRVLKGRIGEGDPRVLPLQETVQVQEPHPNACRPLTISGLRHKQLRLDAVLGLNPFYRL